MGVSWPNLTKSQENEIVEQKLPRSWGLPHPYIYICCRVDNLYIYIYIYVVKLKSGQMFALFKVKKWSNFFVVFLFSKISFSLQKQEDFWKTSQKTTKNTIFKVKKWSNYVAQHNWTTFLTLTWTTFNFRILLFFCFFCFVLWLKPLFYSVFSKKCKIERNTKKKKRHYLWTQLC